MGLLSRLKDLLRNRAAEDAETAVATGDVLVVRGLEVRTLSGAGVTDGYVLTRDSGEDTGLAWAAAGGGGGVTDHDALSAGSLIWTASDHTGTANRIAGFDGTGAASYYVIGTDVQAYDADLAALAANATNGLWARTGVGTGAARTITVSGTGISIANGDGVAGPPAITHDPSASWVAGAKFPPQPTHTVKGILWESPNANVASTSTSLGGNSCRFSMHFEEALTRTYDAIASFTVSGVGNNMKMALYSCHATTGNPDALLWHSAGQSTNTGNTNHVVLFSAGTWTAAGAAYKDGSSQLVLTRGQAIYKASLSDGNVQWRTINTTQVRNNGVSTDTTTGYQYFDDGMTYPTFDDPAVPASRTAALPALILRYV